MKRVVDAVQVAQFGGRTDYLITVSGLKRTWIVKMEGWSKASACLLCVLLKHDHLLHPHPTLNILKARKVVVVVISLKGSKRMKTRQLHETRARYSTSSSLITIVLPESTFDASFQFFSIPSLLTTEWIKSTSSISRQAGRQFPTIWILWHSSDHYNEMKERIVHKKNGRNGKGLESGNPGRDDHQEKEISFFSPSNPFLKLIKLMPSYSRK